MPFPLFGGAAVRRRRPEFINLAHGSLGGGRPHLALCFIEIGPFSGRPGRIPGVAPVQAARDGNDDLAIGHTTPTVSIWPLSTAKDARRWAERRKCNLSSVDDVQGARTMISGRPWAEGRDRLPPATP